MEISQAKKIPLTEVLLRLGFKPVRTWKGGEELAYFSPFRTEKTPSFFVNPQKNVWNDFGGSGGNCLDFVIKFAKTDISGALQFLENLFSADYLTAAPIISQNQDNTKAESKSLVLRQIRPFSSAAPELKEYISGRRGILPKVAEAHLKEVQFHAAATPGKRWFAAGFINQQVGFELRNSWFKGCIGSKDCSFLEGDNHNAISVFEGFIDFLSWLSWRNRVVPETDVLVLNSTALSSRAVKFIRRKNYPTLLTWLDNDAVGKATLVDLIEQTNGQTFPQNSIYHGSQDFNDWFLKTK